VVRETTLITQLAKKMQTAGTSIFQVWMKEESDHVQALARAYGERIILEEFLSVLSKADQGLKPMLHTILALYAWHRVEQSLAWYFVEGILSREQGAQVSEFGRTLCKEIAPDILNVVNAFGFPAHALQAPIATEWEQYNTYDNRGEIEKGHKLW